MSRGGTEPKIMEVRKLGNLQEDKPHESQAVYSENGASQTITAGTHGYGMGYILEQKIVAMRGRDPLNPSDRSIGNPNLEQTLEINSQNVANTLTTVQKDNMVLEVKQATKDGYIECEIGGVADLNYPDSKTRRGRVIEKGQICPTLTTENIPSVLEPWIWEIEGEVYLIRIRKLTPRECWRLMGFTDEDYEKAAAVNSNTQLYKQAGNSIVKNVLMGIFSALM